jgi:hypothetical protein
MANFAPSEGSNPQNKRTESEARGESIRKWFKTNWPQVLFLVGGLALYLLLGLFLWWILQRYVDPSAIKDPTKEATAKKDLLQALGLIMAGVAGAIGIFFTWRGQRLAREAQEDNQRNTQQQLNIALQGQITERFTQAIDQLGKTDDKGNKVVEVRVGAIHALGQIATQFKEDYCWPIIEILCSYVRFNAPRDPSAEVDADKPRFLGHAEMEIQVSLDIIGRTTQRPSDPLPLERLINLQDTDLRNASFKNNANFARCWLRGADLRGAGFGDTNLRNVAFRDADLSYAYFLNTQKLENADFENATLEGTLLENVNLSAAKNLTQSQINLAKGDYNTKLPAGLDRPASWREQLFG